MKKTIKLSRVVEAIFPAFLINNASLKYRGEIKRSVQNGYGIYSNFCDEMKCMNWGMLDNSLIKEYQLLKFDFSEIFQRQDLNGQLLMYNLIRPLMQIKYFNASLLDIGCGTGLGTMFYKQMLNAKQAVGLDLTYEIIKLAAKNYSQEEQLRYVQGDSESLPFPNSSFNIITNLESSHLYPNLNCFYNEILRVLKPGGFFCYADIVFPGKDQDYVFEEFINNNPDLEIIISRDITKSVQKSIYNRLITNEKKTILLAQEKLQEDDSNYELSTLFNMKGLSFLPFYWIWLKAQYLKSVAKVARQSKFFKRKKYFYYLVQKI